MRIVRGSTVLATAALFAASICPGCHLIFPFDVPSASSDAGVEGGPGSDGPAEAAVTDGTGDGAVDGAFAPACPGDTPPVKTAEIDCSCATAVKDCDAIPEAPVGDERDLEPMHCNELIWEETFTKDPLAADRWKTYLGTWKHACGWLHQPSTNPSIDSWVQATAPPLGNSAHYLLEARFRLGAPGNKQVWQVGIAARVGSSLDKDGLPGAFIACVARVDELYDTCYGCKPQRKVRNPDLKVESRNAVDWKGAWPLANPAGNFDSAEGKIYLLQLWYRPLKDKQQINCRLYDEANNHKRNAVYEMFPPNGAGHTQYLPTAPGSVALRTYGRAASYDYVRVFRIKTQKR